MSSSGMPSASLGSGLPPAAPMSPPAQLTSMSTRPSLASMSSFIFATAALSPMFPLTAATLPPCRAIPFATASRSAASRYLAGPVQVRSWIATSAPSSASRSAITRPSPRPEPVTNAILPASSLVIHQSPVLSAKANRVHVAGAAADHRQFVIRDCAIVAALPGRAKVGVVREAIDPRRREAGGERRRRLGCVKAPPFRPQEPHVPGFERAGLEHRIQLPALCRQDVQHGDKRDGAVADRAAHEAIALVGELHAVVLQVHVAHVRSDAADEIERRLGDRKRVAGVETNAEATCRLAKLAKFVAAEVLVIFDRHDSPFVRRARTAVGKRGAHLGDEIFPLVPERVTIAAQHGRQAMADDLRVEKAGRAQRALEWTHRQSRADDRIHAELPKPIAERTEFIVAHRPEPRVVDLENLRAKLGRDGDEAFKPCALRVRAWPAGALQAQMISQPVRVESEGEDLSARLRLKRLHNLVHRSPASTMIDCLVTIRLSSAPRNNAIRAMSSPSSVALMDCRWTL